MPVYTCAVADCTSISKKKKQGVKGWTVFPRKKDAARRRLWETRCKRGPQWRATKDHAICSKHFIDWCQGPSPSHPDPELFAYNQWTATRTTKRSTRAERRHSKPTSETTETTIPSVLKADYYVDPEQEVQVDIQVEVESSNQESASVTAGM